MQRRKTLLITGVLVVGIALVPAGTAYAASTGTPPPPQPSPVEPIADHLVIDGNVVQVAVMPGFPTSGPVVIGTGDQVETAIIESDGTVTTDAAAGRPQSKAALAGCSSWTTWTSPANGLWNQSPPGCSFIGTTADTRAGYRVSVDGNGAAGAYVQIWGHQLTPSSGGGYQWTGVWGGIGAVSPGDEANANIVWGPVADNTYIFTKSQGAVVGSAGMFTNG
jgi:hypothetical protein